MQLDLEMLKAQTEKITALLEVLTKAVNEKKNETCDDLLPSFPIFSRADFDAFNVSLLEKQVRMQMVNLYSQIITKQ